MDDESLLRVLTEAVEAVRSALDGLEEWRSPGLRPGQYRLDLVADAAALEVLHGAGLPVRSEESGITVPVGAHPPDERDLLVVVDPVDGSTNAAHGIPWYATSLCVLDGDGPRLALVVNQATGVRYVARRGGGARRDGQPVAPSGRKDVAASVVGISGQPEMSSEWWQFRALGAAALDLCAVAEGVLDGYLVVGGSSLFPWDYLGGMLVCTEAGAVVAEQHGRNLVTRDDSPRSPVAAATPELLASLMAGRR